MENKESNKISSLENNLKGTKIFLSNGDTLLLNGVSKVISSTQNGISVLLNEQPLEIEGKNLTTTKLDIENGVLEASGNFVSMKFAGHKQKENFFKRIFG